MITKNKTKDVFLTKKQLKARITAGTLEEGVVYHTIDEPAGHALKYENGVLSLLDVDGNAISQVSIGETTSQKIFDLTEDSDTVVREIDNDTGKVNIHLATTVTNKVNNALQMPTTQPTELLMVGLNTNKAQTNIPLGSSLALENGHLETAIKIVKKTQTEYDSLTSYDANTMYVIVG